MKLVRAEREERRNRAGRMAHPVNIVKAEREERCSNAEITAHSIKLEAEERHTQGTSIRAVKAELEKWHTQY